MFNCYFKFTATSYNCQAKFVCLKGVLNSNFRPISFKLRKNKIF